MPAKYDKLVVSGTMHDRRRRFSDKEKERAVTLYNSGEYSYQAVADKCGMSKRMVYFLVNPESRKKNLKRREERGGWRQYHDAEKHASNIGSLRKHKRNLVLKGEFLKAPLKRVNVNHKDIIVHYEKIISYSLGRKRISLKRRK